MKTIGILLTLFGTFCLLAGFIADQNFFEHLFFGRFGVYFAGAIAACLGASCFIDGIKGS